MLLSFGLGMVGVLSIFKLPSTSEPLLPHWEDQIPGNAPLRKAAAQGAAGNS